MIDYVLYDWQDFFEMYGVKVKEDYVLIDRSKGSILYTANTEDEIARYVKDKEDGTFKVILSSRWGSIKFEDGEIVEVQASHAEIEDDIIDAWTD